MALYTVCAAVTVISLTLIRSGYGREWYISHSGKDDPNCGSKNNSCQSLHYTVRQFRQSKANGVIYIDGSGPPYNACSSEYMLIDGKLHIKAYRATFATIDCQSKNAHLFNVTSIKKDTSNTKQNFLSLDGIIIKNARSHDKYNTGTIALSNARLYITNSGFYGNDLIAYNPWQQCYQAFVQIQNSRFVMNQVKHPYQPAIYMRGCKLLNVTFIDVTMIASPIRIQADQNLGISFQNVILDGKYKNFYIRTSLLDITLGRILNRISISQAQVRNQQSHMQSSMSISVNENAKKKSFFHLNNVTFSNLTKAKTQGAALSIIAIFPSQKPVTINFQATDCIFDSNSASDVGGAMYIENLNNMKINHCTFNKNHGGTGGAIYMKAGSKVYFSNCDLSDNKADPKLNNDFGTYGGAMFIDNGQVQIYNSKFVNNMATALGSAIFAHSNASVYLLNSYVESRSASYSDIIHMQTTNVRNNYPYQIANSLINVTSPTNLNGKAHLHVIQTQMKNVDFYCPVGHSYHQIGNQGSPLHFKELFCFCEQCPAGTYNFQQGTNNDSTGSHNTTCQPCPPNGHCHASRVVARANYWGHITDKSKAQFTRCPDGYCCDQEDCAALDNCQGNRSGILCGSCADGYTESITNTHCVAMTSCKTTKFIIAIILSSLLYAIFFIFFFDILQTLGKVFQRVKNIVNRHQFWKKPVDSDSEQTSVFTAEQGYTRFRSTNADIEATNDAEVDGVMTMPPWHLYFDDGTNFTRLVRLVFHLFQVAPLLYTTLPGVPQLLKSVQYGMVNLFHLSVIFDESAETNCASFKMDVVIKEVILVSSSLLTIIAILVIYLFLWLLLQVLSRCCKIQFIPGPFHARFTSAFLHAAILSFMSIALFITRFVNCVKISNVNRLFLDGNLTCFQPWQQVFIALLVVQLVPFIINILVGPYLLINSKVGVQTFIFGCILPLPVLIYICVNLLRHCKRQTSQMEHNPMFNTALRKNLHILCQNCEKLNAELEEETAPHVNHEEAFWLFAKLVYAVLNGFLLHDPSTRAVMLLVWTLVLACCLVPYNNDTDIHIVKSKTGILFILVLLASLNIFPVAIASAGIIKTTSTAMIVSYIWPVISFVFIIILALLILIFVCSFLIRVIFYVSTKFCKKNQESTA